jgi:hypothetical protein
MMIPYLAEVATGQDNETLKTVLAVLGWVTTFAVAIIGAWHLKSAKATSRAEGKAEAMQIGPQPFIVQMREEFATRRELEKLEATMNAHFVEMKGVVTAHSTENKSLFRETMAAMAAQSESVSKKMDRQNKTLSDEIGKVASGAYQGRQKLWTQVNEQRETLGGIKATTDVAAQIGKLADAVNQPVKIQPTHTNTQHA